MVKNNTQREKKINIFVLFVTKKKEYFVERQKQNISKNKIYRFDALK